MSTSRKGMLMIMRTEQRQKLEKSSFNLYFVLFKREKPWLSMPFGFVQ